MSGASFESRHLVIVFSVWTDKVFRAACSVAASRAVWLWASTRVPHRQSQDTLFNQIHVCPESGPERSASVGTRSTPCVRSLPAPGQVCFWLDVCVFAWFVYATLLLNLSHPAACSETRWQGRLQYMWRCSSVDPQRWSLTYESDTKGYRICWSFYMISGVSDFIR